MSIKKQEKHDADPAAACLSDLVKGDVYINTPNGVACGDMGKQDRGLFYPWAGGPNFFSVGNLPTSTGRVQSKERDDVDIRGGGDWGANGNRSGE